MKLLEHFVITTRRLVHFHVEDTSEELLRQLSYAIKNQLKACKIDILFLSLVHHGIREPIMDPRPMRVDQSVTSL